MLFKTEMYPTRAAGTGIARALAIFPIGLILGFTPYWHLISGDDVANWIGYEAFARNAWRWPIFRSTLLNLPEGANILFTDTIP
jgi:hypothetical protein